jgi:hypothetical protein
LLTLQVLLGYAGKHGVGPPGFLSEGQVEAYAPLVAGNDFFGSLKAFQVLAAGQQEFVVTRQAEAAAQVKTSGPTRKLYYIQVSLLRLLAALRKSSCR